MVTGSPDEDFRTNAAAIERVYDQLAADGRYVEASWQSLRMASVPPNASELQLWTMRSCFFAGAHFMMQAVEAWAASSDGEEREKAHAALSAVRAELDQFRSDVMERRRGRS